MTTPKQRLINIIQNNVDIRIKNILENTLLTPEQSQEFLNLTKEKELAAEIVTNTYVLNMTEEEMEDYVSAVEKIYSYQEKLGTTMLEASEDVITRFLENNRPLLLKMIEENLPDVEEDIASNKE
uniref:Uncharacterized protein n=1 Tax=Vibrio phage P018-4 TaxID=3229728 RepID=A0AB39AJK7_9CAUD